MENDHDGTERAYNFRKMFQEYSKSWVGGWIISQLVNFKINSY